MDIATHRDHLTTEGVRLAHAAAAAEWDARVAGAEWSVRELVTHTGGVHRWAAAIIATASPTLDVAEAAAVGSGPADDELLDWYREGLATLVASLHAAPSDLECAAFLPAPSALAFWARRQAHETAIHRADAESASGAITPFDRNLAQDGIAELLRGFGARPRKPTAIAGTIALRADDGDSWSVGLGTEHIEVANRALDEAAAIVRGTSSDLYLWLWNRPAAVRIDGNAELAAQWKTVQVRWSSPG